MLNPVNFLVSLWYLSLTSVIMIILAPTPLHMVFFGILFYLSFGCFFVVTGYDFVGIVLVIVYAGALMVMFLFVIMAFDLARNATLGETVTRDFVVMSWSRLFIFLIFFGLVFKFFVASGAFLFLSDIGCFFVERALPFLSVFHTGEVVLSSVLLSISFTFYQSSFFLLVFCGFLLCLGIVGAVGLTYGVSLRFLKRRAPFLDNYPVSISRRVVLLID